MYRDSDNPPPDAFHASFLPLPHAPFSSAFGEIVISNRYNGLPVLHHMARADNIVPFSISTEQSSDNECNINLDFGHDRKRMPCASRVRTTFRTNYRM